MENGLIKEESIDKHDITITLLSLILNHQIPLRALNLPELYKQIEDLTQLIKNMSAVKE